MRWGEKRYDYDRNGQITRTQYGDGSAERFAYTPDLNIAAIGGETDRFLNWQTTAAGVVRIAHGPKGEVATLEHDACGRVVRRTVARKGFRPQTWSFEWNALDQLVVADGPNGRWRYGYDPFGRRIFKESAGQREESLWDGDVIARAGEVDWFFEPDSFRPMARAERGQLAYVVNDHLGTPKEVMAESGALIWAADHDTWGTLRMGRRTTGSDLVGQGDYWVEPVSLSGGDAPAFAPVPEASFCPIRFQGQWEDAESGLYYNRFRYYEPVAGHYLGFDPIGLLGGTRLTAYVANPSKFIDVYGLQAWRTLGSGICIVQKFPAGNAAAEELASFVGLWNNEIIARGGRMTAGPLTALQERISARWKREFRNSRCCGAGQVAGHVPDAACGGLPCPSNGGMLQMAETNSYLGGITGDMARKKISYTHVYLRDEC